MKINWRKVLTGLKIATGVAIKLNDAHIINVKELGKVKTVKEIIDSEVDKAKPRSLNRVGIFPAEEGDED